MPAIEFDVHGYLPPYTVTTLTLDDFEQKFVTAFADSDRRQLLFDAFRTQLIDFRTTVDKEFWVWVGGSFVTRKINPSNIDFVIFLDADCHNRHEKQASLFR